MFLHVDDVSLSGLLPGPDSDGPVQTAAHQNRPSQGQTGHTLQMTVETVDLLQARSGVEEDQGRDHGGVPSLGCRVGGALASTNHHQVPVPGHTGDIQTCLHNTNLQHSKGLQFPHNKPPYRVFKLKVPRDTGLDSKPITSLLY